MKKRVLISLLAALLLLSAASCKSGGGDEETGTGNESGSVDPNESYIVIPGTDADGNDVTYIEQTTKAPAETEFDPSEASPTFVDCSKEIVVFSAVATVRTETNVNGENAVGWPSEGRVLTATGESDNWYRITYKVGDVDTTCYIAKTVAADASALEGFTAVNEEVVVNVEAVNVRSYPSAKSDLSIRGSLKKGATVTRVGVSENWSKIIYEVTSETETDAEGKPAIVKKEYYVSNDCLSTVADTAE